jgi:hypothetical protein
MPTGIIEIQKLLLQNIKDVINDKLTIDKAKVICQQIQTVINVTKFGCELEQRFEKEFVVPIELFEEKPEIIQIAESVKEINEPEEPKRIIERIKIIPPGMTGDELIGRKQIDVKKLDPKTGRPKDQTDPFN